MDIFNFIFANRNWDIFIICILMIKYYVSLIEKDTNLKEHLR